MKIQKNQDYLVTLNSAKYLNFSGIEFSLCTYIVVVSGSEKNIKISLVFCQGYV